MGNKIFEKLDKKVMKMILILKCPKCGHYSMKYFKELDLWVCLRDNCKHSQKKKPEINLNKNKLLYKRVNPQI